MSMSAPLRIPNSSSVPPEKCVFCQIAARKAPAYILYEDEKYIAFLDIAPFSAGHTLVCPKKHGETIWDMDESDLAGLFRVASRISRAVVSAVGADGFRFVQNNGEAANQVVAHVHVHVIPVAMADKGKYSGRRSFTQDQMKATAEEIRSEVSRFGS
jgi:histidine triad (HIT) family protein